MLCIDDTWVWDFWLADDGEVYHMYVLAAPRRAAEDTRHRAARIEHAISTDLSDWTIVGTALSRGVVGDIDETATWTGSVVRDNDGLWWMFYTGSRFLGDYPDLANIETVTAATSPDLYTWSKRPALTVNADQRWYERLGDSAWPEEAWRDPWVMRDPHRPGWCMLVTARGRDAAVDDRGVIGFAVSDDLANWEVRPPISRPGAGFAHAEVPQVIEIDGQWVLVFSAPATALPERRRRAGERGGIWCMPVSDPVGPFDLTQARLLIDETRYSGKIVMGRDGVVYLMSIINEGRTGDGTGFVGHLADPQPVRLAHDGYLILD